jgi:hypothetical protein
MRSEYAESSLGEDDNVPQNNLKKVNKKTNFKVNKQIVVTMSSLKVSLMHRINFLGFSLFVICLCGLESSKVEGSRA